MGYESMSVQELRAESQRRGLGTARAKSDLIDRLTTHDAVPVPVDVTQDFDTQPIAPPEDPAEEPPIEAEPPAPRVVAAAEPSRFYRMTFPAEAEGPDDEQHLAYRQTTRQAAVDAGLTPRGDAHRIGTVDGHEVYEISLRVPS